MAATYEFLRYEMNALSKLAVPSNVTIASCRDAQMPVYSFPVVKVTAKVSKMIRVESLPFVPDALSEANCGSPLCQDSMTPYFLNDGCYESSSLNSPACGYQPVPSSQLDEDMSVPSVYDLPKGHAEAVWHDDLSGLEIQLVPSSCKSAAPLMATRHALPRRHPSDVFLPPRSRGTATSRSSENLAAGGNEDDLEVPSSSLLEAALTSLWDDRAEKGLFRYDVTQCPTRVLPGHWGFIAQLNEGRANKKRPTELTVDNVVQPFDNAKFNFTKVALSEALVAFRPLTDGHSSDGSCGARAMPQFVVSAAGSGDGVSPNLVLINVSPIDYAHVLLVPRVLDRLPQALSPDTMLLALQFARELNSPFFRVGYNSLGAYATINHLHFQSYYLAGTMPCEMATTTPLPDALAAPPVPGFAANAIPAFGPNYSRKRPYDAVSESTGVAVRVSRLREYPVNGFVLEASRPSMSVHRNGGSGDPEELQAIAAVLSVAVERLQAVNQPFNLLIFDGGRRVFLFPQCFAERLAAGTIADELTDTGVHPAAFEIGGHLLLKRSPDYQCATEDFAQRLLEQASLPEDRFMAVARLCFSAQ